MDTVDFAGYARESWKNKSQTCKIPMTMKNFKFPFDGYKKTPVHDTRVYNVKTDITYMKRRYNLN